MDRSVSGGIKFFNVAAAEICHIQVRLPVEGEAERPAQAAADIRGELGAMAGRVDFLYGIVAEVGHIEITDAVEGQPNGVFDAERGENGSGSVGVKFFNRIAVVIRGVEGAVGAKG